jgi:hypothetical protein
MHVDWVPPSREGDASLMLSFTFGYCLHRTKSREEWTVGLESK